MRLLVKEMLQVVAQEATSKDANAQISAKGTSLGPNLHLRLPDEHKATVTQTPEEETLEPSRILWLC